MQYVIVSLSIDCGGVNVYDCCCRSSWCKAVCGSQVDCNVGHTVSTCALGNAHKEDFKRDNGKIEIDHNYNDNNNYLIIDGWWMIKIMTLFVIILSCGYISCLLYQKYNKTFYQKYTKQNTESGTESGTENYL